MLQRWNERRGDLCGEGGVKWNGLERWLRQTKTGSRFTRTIAILNLRRPASTLSFRTSFKFDVPSQNHTHFYGSVLLAFYLLLPEAAAC